MTLMTELGLDGYMLMRDEPWSVINRALEASRRRNARQRHQDLQDMAQHPLHILRMRDVGLEHLHRQRPASGLAA